MSYVVSLSFAYWTKIAVRAGEDLAISFFIVQSLFHLLALLARWAFTLVPPRPANLSSETDTLSPVAASRVPYTRLESEVLVGVERWMDSFDSFASHG